MKQQLLVLEMVLRRGAERGAGMAEYVLLLALVAAAMIAAFTGLVTNMQGAVSNIAAEISN